MATNHYFQSGIPMGMRQESLLHEDLIIEALKIYGFDCYYLPRTEVHRDYFFTEDPLQKFEDSYAIEMYLSNVNGFSGEGDLLSKFGVEIRDQATFVVARRRWAELIGKNTPNAVNTRPAEGDIVFLPITNSFFEIKRVEMLNPFFQVGKLYVYELQCELYQYSSEDFDTGDAAMDSIIEVNSLDILENVLQDETGAYLSLETYNDNYIILEDYDIEDADVQAQNDDYDIEIQNILDFSEINPFGEIT